ncbi:MAG: ATP-binding protein [Gammaproteobacteria bacterium]|nr:ATP-binding protein [Gammaproteobacteria bacterium]
MSKSDSSLRAGQQQDILVWLTPLLLATIVVATSFYSFLLFHTLAEFFAIVVAILMCVVAWQTHPFTRNNFLMYLGCGYFWVACLDMAHTLAYKDMNIFSHVTSSDTSIQLWIGTRFMEAFLLLTSPFFLNRGLNRNLVFTGYGVIASIIFFLVMLDQFPLMFIEGQGLTETKVASEYLIMTLLAFSMWFLYQRRHYIEAKITRMIFASITLTICAELSFTFYISVYGISNQAGHIFKLVSFWLIFVAIVRTTLKEPFSTMAQDATTYDAIPVATIVIDQNNRIRQVNNRACEMAYMTKNQLVGLNAHQVFHPLFLEESNCTICQHMKDGIELHDYEIQNVDKNTWLDFSLSPISMDKTNMGTVQVIRDITDRKQIELELNLHRDNLEGLVSERTHELAIARDRALAATKSKSTFLANMSHELRTPLNSIIGFTGIVKSGMAGAVNEVQEKQLGMAHNSAKHLLSLINDILDLSKIEAGKMKAHMETFKVASLLKELQEQNQVLFDEKKIQLIIAKIPATLEMTSDRTKVFQIILNLLSNGLKFTKKGYVRLDCQVEQNQINFSVEDTGVGIDKEDLKNVFDSFHQVKENQNMAIAGTGLGLAICKRFAELLKGDIVLASYPGQGSVFTLTLPIHNSIDSSADYAAIS